MRAMILAAGLGKRLRPLTNKTPKPLLQLAGKTLIERHIENLARAGIKDIMINCHHLAAQLPSYLGNGDRWQIKLHYSNEKDQLLGTGGGILHCLDWFGETPFIVINSDIWTSFEITTLPQKLTGCAHLVLVDNMPEHPGGDFALHGTEVQNTGCPMLTFSGIGIYTHELFKTAKQAVFPLPKLLRQAAQKGLVNGCHYKHLWMDIGTPERLQKAQQLASKMPPSSL